MAKKVQPPPELLVSPTAETANDLSAGRFNNAKTIQDAPVQTWPPRPRPRRSRLSLTIRIIAIVLASLLIVSGLGFIVYSATVQYHGSLRAVATRDARATQSVIRTAQAHQQATAQVLATAQAYINATATAQDNTSIAATASVDNTTATATTLGNLLTEATKGTPSLDDTLSDSSGQGKWDEGSTINNTAASTGCMFKDGRYHVSEAQQGYLQPCIAESTQFTNFAYQVQVTLNKGTEGQAGLLFHIDSTNKAYYFFSISSNGFYALDLYSSTGRVHNLSRGISTTITTGMGQQNQLSVLAKSGIYYLFANGQHLVTVTDSTLRSGKIGLAVINHNVPTDAEFSNVQVWK